MKMNKKIDKQKVKKYYQEIENYDWTKAADHFVGPESFLHRSREKEVVKLIEKYGNGRYLDVGCGTGLLLRHMPDGSTGIDINPRNIEKAKNYCPGKELIEGDIEEDFHFEDKSFDTIVCTEVLEHLVNPDNTLKEINRVMSDKSVFIGSVPGKSIIWKLRALSFSSNNFNEEPFHVHRNKIEVKKLLEDVFEIDKLYSKMYKMNWFFVLRKK